jgi:kanosamine 6-kinase
VARVGLDIGGTKAAVLVQDRAGRRTASARWPPDADPAADVALLGALLAAAGAGKPVEAVGVALPASVDAAGTVLAWPSRPSWVGLDVGAALTALLPGAVARWADDGTLAALAEARAVGCRDLAYLGVGTGVGGGLVLGGEPLGGVGVPAELGHLVVHPGGRVCACGRRGCLQATASGPATLARAARGRGAPTTGAELATAAASGAGWAIAALGDTVEALALAIASLGEVARPARVHLGGGLGAALPGLALDVGRRVRGLARPGRPAPVVAPAVLGAESSLHGALLLAHRQSTPREASHV